MTSTIRPFASLGDLVAFLETLAEAPSQEAEGLSELDHGLQCAHTLARWAPEDVALQIAGLLHDVGHTLSPVSDHAGAGEAALRDVMGPRVARLVGLHVAAKRYLVAREGAYFAALSPLSVETLRVQGGPFSADEAAAFETLPDWREAVRLRRADEAAKVAGLKVPGLDAWREALRHTAGLAA